MTDRFEQANDTVVESGYKNTEEFSLVSAETSNTAKPSSASDGQKIGSSSRSIIVAWAGDASTSFDVEVWGYYGSTIGWRRIQILDKTGIDEDGESWKANLGGVDRLYTRIQNIAGGGEANVSILRAYS